MIELTACPSCNSQNISKYHQIGFAPRVFYEIMPGVKVEAGVISRYCVCQDCHLIFQNPRLSDQELDKFYSRGYYRRTINMTDEEKDEDELLRAELDAKIIKEHCGEVSSHLDIGCSRGFLLKKVNAEIKVGIEADKKGVKEKDINVYLSIDKVTGKKFDLVTAIHLLEHVSKPLSYLHDMSNFISKYGFLVIEVPTWKSPGGPLRLAHLHCFDPDVLRLMCKQVGLDVIHTEFTPHLMLICKLG